MKPHHEAYLERNAREFSRQLKRKVRPEEVLELLLELAIVDERIYDGETGAVLGSLDRDPLQPTRQPSRGTEPAGRFAPLLLLQHLRDAG